MGDGSPLHSAASGVGRRRDPGLLVVLGRAAAFQTVSFPRVEGWSYNSVMVTSNFRQTIEGLFAAFAGSADTRPFRYSLAVPVTLPVFVLLLCQQKPVAAEA